MTSEEMSKIEPDEKWIEAINWPEYEVSSFGNVRRIVITKNKKYTRPIKPWTMKNGYLMVVFSRFPQRKYILVHRLVFESFNGSQGSLDICHNDGTRNNNYLNNLRSDTRSGNMSDLVKHDTHIRGERCGTNKHSKEKIIEFKKDIKNGMNVRQASFKNNLPYQTGYGIAQGKTWAWVIV